jgi:hypothetical protein
MTKQERRRKIIIGRGGKEVKEGNEREEVNILHLLYIGVIQKTITLQKLTSSDDLNM